jgi:hypothetical protein
VEVLLPPLGEEKDAGKEMNEIEEMLRKARIEKSNERPKVLYLDNDDAIEDIEQNNNPPAFIEDDAFDSEANFDGIIKKHQDKSNMMSKTLKVVPTTKTGANNLLSEISEEDTTDVISMVSERRLALKKQETEAAAR